MNTSEVSFESLMMEKLLQEEYADVAPSVNPGANEVYTYLFEAEQTYLEIMKALLFLVFVLAFATAEECSVGDVKCMSCNKSCSMCNICHKICIF